MTSMARQETTWEHFKPGQLEPGSYFYSIRFMADAREASSHEHIPVNVIRGEEEGPTLLVLAAVHGDEYEGVQTVLELTRMLKPSDVRGTLLLVPVTNADAYANTTRTSGSDGGNLARAFPGKPDGSYTERLAWHVDQALIQQSDFLLDLHSGGTDYAMPPMVGYYHQIDEDASVMAWQAARVFGMPVIWGHEQVGPGRTVSAATDRRIPWLYTEGYGGQRIRPEEQRLYREGALRLMRFLDMLTRPAEWVQSELLPTECELLGDGNLDKAVVAEHDGFFVPEVSLLDEVKQGEVLGRIYDDAGQELQTIQADSDGVVMMLRAKPPTKKGAGLYTLATKLQG